MAKNLGDSVKSEILTKVGLPRDPLFLHWKGNVEYRIYLGDPMVLNRILVVQKVCGNTSIFYVTDVRDIGREDVLMNKQPELMRYLRQAMSIPVNEWYASIAGLEAELKRHDEDI